MAAMTLWASAFSLGMGCSFFLLDKLMTEDSIKVCAYGWGSVYSGQGSPCSYQLLFELIAY